jgi:hypothetical protein
MLKFTLGGTNFMCLHIPDYLYTFFVAVHSRLAMSHSRAIVQARIVPVSSVGHMDQEGHRL